VTLHRQSGEIYRLRRNIRGIVALFIVGLVLSGLTAFPLVTELNLLCSMAGLSPDARSADFTGLRHWLLLVREALTFNAAKYPFLAYGTDWLAFGHIVIALFFIAPFREPGRHLEVINVGIAACILVIPLALICGPIRGIPFYWQLIDCSFGVIGIIPLLLVRRFARRLNFLEGGHRERND
jgi:hypothetical protein